MPKQYKPIKIYKPDYDYIKKTAKEDKRSMIQTLSFIVAKFRNGEKK